MQNEISIARQKLKNKPADVTRDIAKAQAELAALVKEADLLEAELSDLQKQKDGLEKEFAEYRLKYPTP